MRQQLDAEAARRGNYTLETELYVNGKLLSGKTNSVQLAQRGGEAIVAPMD